MQSSRELVASKRESDEVPLMSGHVIYCQDTFYHEKML